MCLLAPVSRTGYCRHRRAAALAYQSPIAFEESRPLP
jgi:hypothetical protein